MSAATVILSGYLAGISSHGAEPQDVVEVQSRVEVVAGGLCVHAAHTLDVILPGAPAGPSDALRDLSTGAAVTLGAVRVVGAVHALDTVRGGAAGRAAYGGVGARVAGFELALGAGAVEAGGALGGQLALRATRPRVTPWLDATAIVHVTDARLSAGGELAVRAGRRVDLTLGALVGSRSHALLADGQTIEATSGTQHELVHARAAFDLGRLGSVFAAALARRETTAGGREVLVTAALAGTAFAF